MLRGDKIISEGDNMLAKIIIKNFMSFKNETVIDFTKTNYKFLENNVSDEGILKGIAFYGANASGKSNVLYAIRFLLDKLFRETENPAALMKCLFSDEPEFSLQYFFVIENKEIRYLFEHDISKGITSEKLYVDEELLLERMGSTAKSYITEKKSYTDLDNEILFLRTVYFNTGFSNNSVLRKWFEYMQNLIYINPFIQGVISYSKQDMRINKYLKDNGVEEINQFFRDFNFEYTLDYISDIKVKETAKIIDSDDVGSILFKRKGIYVPIPYFFESLGNKNLLNLLPSFLYIVRNGGMLLIDEFSSGFHNELERLLVNYFFKNATNSQIFFVSHSTNLLSTSILRPDQIYTVEFNGEQGSQVKRVSDEQPRLAQNLEKMYLSGVFGGLPNYEDK